MTISEDQLKLVIVQFEEDRNQLQKELNESLLQEDYISAHHFSEAIERLNRQLNVPIIYMILSMMKRAF